MLWLVSSASRLWILISALIFGKDTTQSWNLFGLHGTQLIGVLAILFIIVFTYLSSRGMTGIKIMSSIGGVIDSMKHSEKDFPKGLIISSLFTIVSYVLTDFSVNYQRDIVQTGANTGNITYVVYGR